MRKLKFMVQDIDRDTVNRINEAACNFFGITVEQLYSTNKKTKVCTSAFCHILYYLHYEAGVSINQLAKEYNAAFSKKTKVLNQKDTLKESRKKDR